MATATRCLLIPIVSLALMPVWAEEGRIPIFEPIAISGAAVGGKYVVTRNITGTGSGVTLDFTGTGTENVDVDLNGFDVANTAAGTSAVIRGTDLGRLTVRNGSIVATVDRTGLESVGVVKVVAEGLFISNVNDGVNLTAPTQFVVRRNLIDTAARYGIRVTGNASADNSGVIDGNQVRKTNQSGIHVSNQVDDVTVKNNRVRDAGLTAESYGIVIDASSNTDGDAVIEIRRNSVRNTNGWGMLVGSYGPCAVEGNHVGGSTRSGIRIVALGCLIEKNVARLNDEAGMLISGDKNQIKGNVLTDNGYGLWFTQFECPTQGFCGSDNTYTKNTARGNTSFGGGCGTIGVPTCGAPDLCDEGANNASFGDNLIPGPGPC